MLHIRLIWDRISSQFNLDIIFLKLRIKLNFNYCNTRWLQTNIKRPRNPSNLMWNVLTGEALILALWFLLITSQSGISTKAAFRTDDNMMNKLTIILFNIGKNLHLHGNPRETKENPISVLTIFPWLDYTHNATFKNYLSIVLNFFFTSMLGCLNCVLKNIACRNPYLMWNKRGQV